MMNPANRLRCIVYSFLWLSDAISRREHTVFVAAIDDAHYFRVDSIEKAVSQIPGNAFSILLSHTHVTRLLDVKPSRCFANCILENHGNSGRQQIEISDPQP